MSEREGRLARRALILACVALFAAAPAPEGSFTMSGGSGPYHDGGSVTFTITRVTHAQRNDEVTLGVRCTRADGTNVPVGDQWMQHVGKSPYLAEWNTFGGFDGFQPVFELYYGGDYTCLAQIAVISWFKGEPTQAWIIYGDAFIVDN